MVIRPNPFCSPKIPGRRNLGCPENACRCNPAVISRLLEVNAFVAGAGELDVTIDAVDGLEFDGEDAQHGVGDGFDCGEVRNGKAGS